MQIIKRNGNTTIYDDQKIIKSILKANEASKTDEKLTEKEAASIAFDAVEKLTAESEIISTRDIRDSVYKILCERNLNMTAKTYLEYKKNG